MAQKTDTELTTQAQVIRDETTALANTKTRVYTNLKDAIDSKINNDKIIDEDNMASNSASHVPTQQSTKAYVDEEIANAALSIVTSWKNPVRAATTVNGTDATDFENGDTIDGVVLASGDRFLRKNQTDQKENGIFIVAASGAPSRSADANIGSELDGAGVTVLEGTTNANTTWLQTTDSVTIGVSNIVWTQLGTNVPPADGTTPGILKLYSNLSAQNTDGAPDQNSVVDALALKADITAVVGVQDLYVSAAAMWPRATGGCSVLTQYQMTTSLFNIQGLEFSETTQQFAQLQAVLPRKWNGGTITVVVYWKPLSSSSGTVQWGVSGGAYSNDDALTVALGTAQTVDDTFIATDDLHVTDATSAITLAGTPADADFLAIQISRNPASDTMAVKAVLLGISIRITTNAGVDA